MEIFKILGKIAVENDEANKNIRKTRGEADSAQSKITEAFKKIGTAVATYFAFDKIADFGKACLNAAADAQAMESQFHEVFGWISASGENLEARARASLSSIADQAGISENRMKGSFTKIAAFAKTTGMSTEESLELTERAMVAVADSAAFYDRTLEETTESLQSFLKGNFENDAALGLSCTETTRNAAANALYGKSFNELSESQKQLTLLKMVEDANALSGALGQAARESDTWTNQIGNLKQSWEDFKAIIGDMFLEKAIGVVGWLADTVENLGAKAETVGEKFQSLKTWFQDIGAYIADEFQPIIEGLETAWTNVKDTIQPYIDKLSEYVTSGEAAEDITTALKDAISFVADAFTRISDWCSEHQTLLETIIIIVGSFAAAWGLVNGAIAIWNGICAVASAVTTAFGTAMTILTSPITLVVLAIGALIAIIVLCVKHWDVIKAKVQEVWSNIVTWVQGAVASVGAAIDSMVAWLSEAWTSIKETVSSVWNGIWEVIKGVINSIIGGVENMVNNVINGINTILSGINSVASAVGSALGLDWSVGTLPSVSLPRLYEGGVLERGQVGLLEGSGAEAVVPLENNRKWISAVAADMDAAFGGGEAVVILREMLEEISGLKDAIASMKFEINNREFGRLVKAVN